MQLPIFPPHLFLVELVDKSALIDLFQHCDIDKIFRFCSFGLSIFFRHIVDLELDAFKRGVGLFLGQFFISHVGFIEDLFVFDLKRLAKISLVFFSSVIHK